MTIDERYFKDNENQAQNIEDVLMDNEKILWKAKPNKKSYILASVFKMLPFALLWLLFDGFFIAMIVIGMVNDSIPVAILAFIIPFFIFHLAPVWIWIKNIIKSSLEIKNIEYAITQQRIIIRSGVIGIDFKSLTFPEIENINVKVSLIDKLCKVGDIYINAATNSAVLYDLSNPYDLSKKLQKIVVDIKSDLNYPNAYRPKENNGYETTYNSNPFEDDKH